jgi:hypothetical protein
MRWRAVVYYRTQMGVVDVEHYFEELHDLHELVEQGPDCNTIKRIEVSPRRAEEDLIVEHVSQHN